LFHQTGVIRVDTIEELFDVAQVVGSQPLGRGVRVAVLSNAGGPAVLAVDACIGNGLQVPEFSVGLQGQVAELCPHNGGASNPIDLGAAANAAMYEQVLGLLLSCGEVDAVAVNFTPPLVTHKTDDVATAIAAAVDRAAARAEATGTGEQGSVGRPVVASLLGADEGGHAVLRSARHPVPSFTYPETAVRALAHALRYAEWRHRPSGVVPVLEGVDINKARRRLPRHAVTHGGAEGPLERGWVTGAAAMDVLAAIGIPVARTVEAYSAEEAGKWAAEIGAAVALKVLGPVRKSEGGGVQLGLQGYEAVAAAYEAMHQAFGDAMTGALVQPMAPAGGVETTVGARQDAAFGPLVVFGLGGVTVEVLDDHLTRMAPLTDLDAMDMVTGLRGSRLLMGYRGRPGVAIGALVDVLHRVSRLVEDVPEIAELDCNPVIATPTGVVVVDARVRVDGEASRSQVEDTRHLR
jgi:acyl-CoA synthetase (NDP forming)